jgi:hypothetical protein
MTRYALFETKIGWAGIACSGAGLIGVHLPEPDREAARRSFIRRFPEMAEAPVPTNQISTVTRICTLLRGAIGLVRLSRREALALEVGRDVGIASAEGAIAGLGIHGVAN